MEKFNIQWPGWETVRLIGSGSYGAVYEIERDIFGKKEKAALKHIGIPQNPSDIEEMYSDGYDDESITTTFQSHLESIISEYTLMRKLNGAANVVNCDDVQYIQREDGIGWDIYIKMELLTPLTKALPDQIPEETVIRIAKDMCHALSLCKRFDIVHRDIKPQNIFVSPLGDYKLGDFGIAKTVEKTMGGTKTGTYKYMSPEVYNNQPYGHQADIYSLGLVLYWLLNRRRMPFMPLPPAKLTAGMDEQARILRLSGKPLPPPADGSDDLKRIVLKACAYNPKDRYRTAEEMLADLETLGGGRAVRASTDQNADPSKMADTAVEKSVTAAEDEMTSYSFGATFGGKETQGSVACFTGMDSDEATIGPLSRPAAIKNNDIAAAASEAVTAAESKDEATIGPLSRPAAIKNNDIAAAVSEAVTAAESKEDATVGAFGGRGKPGFKAGQKIQSRAEGSGGSSPERQTASPASVPLPKTEKNKKRSAAIWAVIAAGAVALITGIVLLTGLGKDNKKTGRKTEDASMTGEMNHETHSAVSTKEEQPSTNQSGETQIITTPPVQVPDVFETPDGKTIPVWSFGEDNPAFGTYILVPYLCDWTEAQAFAREMGGHLVCFETEAEYDYVLSSFLSLDSGLTYIRIGGRRDPENKEYHWADEYDCLYGDTLNGSDTWAANVWHEGEPSFTWEKDVESFMELTWSTRFQEWGWNDSSDSYPSSWNKAKVGFLVEFESIWN